MAKSDFISGPLLPVVLVAGILSGTLWRGGPAADSGKPGDARANADRLEEISAAPDWISSLRPVMETLDATLGGGLATSADAELDLSRTVALAAGRKAGGGVPSSQPEALKEKGAARDAQIRAALATLRTGLDRLASPSEEGCTDVATLKPSPTGRSMQAAAAVLGAWLLTQESGDAKDLAAAARVLRDEYRDWRLLEQLVRRVQPKSDVPGPPAYDVDFIVGTMPDYVDSNSGWLADQGLAALQAGMVEEDYVFDRVKLIDWSRSQAGTAAGTPSSLHERQPGAIVFRKVDLPRDPTIHVQVVLVVLETPTAGVHRGALRNSLRFLRAWDACTKRPRALRVLGPTFSGSTLSLASVIGEQPFADAFQPRIVITGSATASENAEIMKTFGNGAVLRATVVRTALLQTRMARFLESLNPVWKDGNRVALLVESNTAFGRDVSNETPRPFAHAKVFQFPLHVAQLRSDAPALEQPAALLSGPVIPLDLREAVPPSDLIPALRPQLTSPIVNSTVDSILDAIRHEKLTAVGILATDDRDMLFLAREVKRASPDVQLFLFGTHGLYLHPDFVPYLRGALVASSYALTLANQPEIAASSRHPQMRQPFASMTAEGAFYGVRALLTLDMERLRADPRQLTYCADGQIEKCVPPPPVSINVIGEDGYWTLTAAEDPHSDPPPSANPDDGPPPGKLHIAQLPGLPLPFTIGALVVMVIVMIHLAVIYWINRSSGDPSADTFLEWPFVRVLAPPKTVRRAAGYHRFAVGICLALLALAAAWVEAIVLPFVVGGTGALSAMVVGVTVIATVLLILYSAFHIGPRPISTEAVMPPAAAATDSASERRAIAPAEIISWTLFVGMVLTMVSFSAIVFQAIAGLRSDEWRLTLARIVGGGIVSPAALTMCLAVAFYTVVLMGARRLSLVGYGYSWLAQGSSTFRLFTAQPPSSPISAPQRGSFAAMLDMPVQNMTLVYPLMLLLFMAVAILATWRVSAIDGQMFSLFLSVGTWTTLGLGLQQLLQGAALWNSARSHLKRLARTPVESRFRDIAPHVTWNISLAPPRLSEMAPVARMADMVVRDFRTLGLDPPHTRGEVDMCRNLEDFSALRSEAEHRLGLRKNDLRMAKTLFGMPRYLELLHTEMGTRQHAALIQSDSWLAMWRLSDELVTLLEVTAWQRSSEVWRGIEAVALAPTGTEGKSVVIPQPPVRFAGPTPQVPAIVDDRPPAEQREGWFKRGEQLIALQLAFVVRDVVARTVTSLFAAMLCLTLLTAAHLFYTFNGRTSMLTIDMVAVAAAALVSVWILVDMERDHVLSRLRSTRPGSVDFNWEFIKRIAIYGVLPLLAVIAALFPEVGGTLFGWLEPLRKLWTF